MEAHRKTRRAPLKEKRTVAIECLVMESKKKVTCPSPSEWLLQFSEKWKRGGEKESGKEKLWAGYSGCFSGPKQRKK